MFGLKRVSCSKGIIGIWKGDQSCHKGLESYSLASRNLGLGATSHLDTRLTYEIPEDPRVDLLRTNGCPTGAQHGPHVFIRLHPKRSVYQPQVGPKTGVDSETVKLQ